MLANQYTLAGIVLTQHVFECRLVEEHPQLLDVEGFELALTHARETIPSLDVVHMMRYNPSMIFGFQRGAQLIPYDEVPTSPQQSLGTAIVD